MTPDSILPGNDVAIQDRTRREIVFAEEYVRTGGDTMTAVIRSGIRHPQFPADIIGRQLLDRPDIRLCIQIMEKHKNNQAPVEVTRESIVADMQQVFEAAMRSDRLSDGIAAKRMQAALLGYMVERKEVTLIKDVGDMSNAELRRIALKGRIIEGSAEDGGDGDGGRESGAG